MRILTMLILLLTSSLGLSRPGAADELYHFVPRPLLPPPIANFMVGKLIEDFSGDQVVGEFPHGWRAKTNNGKYFYRIGEQNGRNFLQVDAIKDATWIGRPVEWDIEHYPILEWMWRSRILPKDGNETKSSRNDCTVAISVIFPIRFIIPDTMKYTWSTTLPIGTEFSNGGGKNKIRIVRSGAEHVGEWLVERRNLAEDYQRRFSRKARNPVGIAVITDADDTYSTSSGDYAYFRLLSLEEAKDLPLSP